MQSGRSDAHRTNISSYHPIIICNPVIVVSLNKSESHSKKPELASPLVRFSVDSGNFLVCGT